VPFIAGLELNRRFYEDVVRPLLVDTFPELAYSAALLGPGSETLGFDTEMSMDHDWGLRFFLFFHEEDKDQGLAVTDMLSQRLPDEYAGFPVSWSTGAREPKWGIMERPLRGPIKHRVIATTVRDFVRVQLGYNLSEMLTAVDWLTFPSHALGELVGGEIYHDGISELSGLREWFAWYPRDIWLYLLACGWQRIGQEEHLMPRAGSSGDELGSSLIAARLVRDVMNLCFLMERRYAPYAKWFGGAFKRLRCAVELEPALWQVERATTWRERMDALTTAYELLARMHNQLEISAHVPQTASSFYERPFKVIHGELFAQALVEQIIDPEVQRIAARGLIGSISQWSDSVDMEGIERKKVRQLYLP
jgi:hypothetical protein